MKNRFDIFWFGENGPNWIDAVETLQTAKEQIKRLPRTIQAAMLSLTTERATVFRSPRSFVPAELGSSKVCLPDWRCSVCQREREFAEHICAS